MKAVLQRVLKPATVKVNNRIEGHIEKGLVVFLGVEELDNIEDIKWLARKIINMRIFSDAEGKMNLSLINIEGELLVISQFTLYASTKKGNRPSFLKSAPPKYAEEMYNKFIDHIMSDYKVKVERGVFGGDMKVEFTNDGPVTIIIDTKNKA